MFERILIANRGEVAARVARTCRRIGIDTIAVHVGTDEGDPHVTACDEHVQIGDTYAAYLDRDAILTAAKQAGVHAIHPGYGSLASDPEFAKAVEEAELLLVGPGSAHFAAVAEHIAVREVATAAGVRILPGSERAISGPQEALLDVDEIGYPVVVRPARRVGEGRITIAHDVADLAEGLAALDPLEAHGGALLERYIEDARHVEVQFFVHGTTVVLLGDREVSVRQNGRRVLCESPAPALDQLNDEDTVRGAMYEAATDIAAALQCQGLSSVQFVIAPDGVFYFTAFVPGLQVEHSTIEMCSGLDLVELQLQLTAGDTIDERVHNLQPTGCALQARIDASCDLESGLTVQADVKSARWPPAPQGKVRIETGVDIGSAISADRDPLVATVTTYAPTRHDALLMLDRILAEIHLAPVMTNQELLRRALNHESLRAGQYDDGFLDRL